MLESLLLSQDRAVLATLESACATVGITPIVCAGEAQAAALLRSRKFYGLIVDTNQLQVASAVLTTARASASSRNATSIVVRAGSSNAVSGTFCLRKPVPSELATRTLRAAKGLMLNEFRRYYRHPFVLPVTIAKDSGGELQASTINVSCRGFATKAVFENLATGDVVRTRLTLPDGNYVEMKSKLVWSEPNVSGFQFEGSLARDRQRLEDCLATRLPLK